MQFVWLWQILMMTMLKVSPMTSAINILVIKSPEKGGNANLLLWKLALILRSVEATGGK